MIAPKQSLIPLSIHGIKVHILSKLYLNSYINNTVCNKIYEIPNEIQLCVLHKLTFCLLCNYNLRKKLYLYRKKYLLLF